MAWSMFDIYRYVDYDFIALAKNECRDLQPAQRPHKATINRGFFMPIKNTGGIVPFGFCYGGLYWAAP